ncbi:high affinity immunoglobulin epsilon receptor subunit gamma [Trichomycterus rosablanca]|uniref:high affinity immunoglobulin epsilon receptor subunit gamma n=1 Tax=Trichomycterus rosablanca TaxID=2290929 RepID=UPI002F35755B
MKNTGLSGLTLIPLSMTVGQAAALQEFQICYILDAVLFIYGLVLTVLYCRMKIMNERAKNNVNAKKEASEGVYEGLSHQTQDTYDSINMKRSKS